VHDDHEILGRLIRDELSEDIDELIIDSKSHSQQLRRMLAGVIPSLKKKITLYDNIDENLFEKYGVEAQFQKALRRRVWLKSGGYIVIDEAEALVAIDVNTGKFVGRDDQEATILQTNLEAAEVVAQQLRLRDVGGIIVIDFIDMKSRENQHKLLRRFKELLKKDRAKTTVVPLTEYGLMQMTRKRVRQSLSKVMFKECLHCQGSGRVLVESQVWKNIKYEILRLLKTDPSAKTVQITVHPDMRKYLESEMLDAARAIANRRRAALTFVDNREFHLEQYSIARLEESTQHVDRGRPRRRGQKNPEKTLEKAGQKEG
jgi:ribonuclease G